MEPAKRLYALGVPKGHKNRVMGECQSTHQALPKNSVKRCHPKVHKIKVIWNEVTHRITLGEVEYFQ